MEARFKHSKRNNIEIMIGYETDETMKNFLILFYKNIKKPSKNQLKAANLFFL